jgi:hypothetical protein
MIFDPVDIMMVCAFATAVWIALCLRDRASDLAAKDDGEAVDMAAIPLDGRTDEDDRAERRRQAVKVVQWCNAGAGAQLPDVGKLVSKWCGSLDFVEVGAIDIVGVDELARHFLGKHVPGLPPLATPDVVAFRRGHSCERRALRDEIEWRANSRRHEIMAAKLREKEGRAAGGGPRKKPGEIEMAVAKGPK